MPVFHTSPSNSVAAIVDVILDEGSVSSIPDNFCCPPCGRYVLASVETFNKYAEIISYELECCYNIKASIETYLKFTETQEGRPAYPDPCDNPSFENCYAQMISELNLSGAQINNLLDKGIVETGAIGLDGSGSSYLCILADCISSAFNLQTVDPSSKAEILDRILDKGIVIDCTGNTLVIASIETWGKLYEVPA
jgi:hypothetical protein